MVLGISSWRHGRQNQSIWKSQCCLLFVQKSILFFELYSNMPLNGWGLAAHHWATADEWDGQGAAPMNLKFSVLTPIYPIKCYCSLSCNENMPLHGWGLDDPLLGNSSWRQGGWAWAPPTNLKFSMLIHISLFLCSWNSQTAIILYKDILSLSLYSPVLGTVKPLSCYAKTFSLPLSLFTCSWTQSNSYYVIQRHSLSLSLFPVL